MNNNYDEDLKKIVRETSGVWHEGASIVYLSWYGVDSVCWSRYPSCHDNIKKGSKTYSRQEFERCLAEMTGRPLVKDWPEWAEFICILSYSDKWLFCEVKPTIRDSGAWFVNGKCIHDRKQKEMEKVINWTESIITREEALEREKIMLGCSSLLDKEPKASNVMPDWFRNDDLPPIGTVIGGTVYGSDKGQYRVLAVDGNMCWLKRSGERSGDTIDYMTVEYTNLLPRGFDINEIHEEAIIENNERQIELIARSIEGSVVVVNGNSISSSREIAKLMIEDGCTFTNKRVKL